KYAPLVPVLRDLISRSDTPLDAAAKEHILAHLDRAAERVAALRGGTGGGVADGRDPPGRDAQPRKAEWDRFALEFADGGRLALFDKRRLGRIVLNPRVERLGPDAVTVTPAEFRALISKGTIAVKARLLDQTKI